MPVERMLGRSNEAVEQLQHRAVRNLVPGAGEYPPAEAELRGIEYGDSSYYDLIARLKYKLAGPAFLAGGYRYEQIEIDEKDIFADIEFSGPFAEFGFDI